jgi:putative Mg2+ transporter-C (MgtC) family protein
MGVGAALWQELVAGFPDNVEIARIAVRLVVAIALGGILGFQRAHVGKAAGMRTHMLVTLGAAIVVLMPQLTGMSSADSSRIIQGTLTGIGFIGGGVILKMSEQHQIVGITTAASIWLTSIIGIVTGTGRLGLAVAGTTLAYIILTAFGWLEHEMIAKRQTIWELNAACLSPRKAEARLKRRASC